MLASCECECEGDVCRNPCFKDVHYNVVNNKFLDDYRSMHNVKEMRRALHSGAEKVCNNLEGTRGGLEQLPAAYAKTPVENTGNSKSTSKAVSGVPSTGLMRSDVLGADVVVKKSARPQPGRQFLITLSLACGVFTSIREEFLNTLNLYAEWNNNLIVTYCIALDRSLESVNVDFHIHTYIEFVGKLF